MGAASKMSRYLFRATKQIVTLILLYNSLPPVHYTLHGGTVLSLLGLWTPLVL